MKNHLKSWYCDYKTSSPYISKVGFQSCSRVWKMLDNNLTTINISNMATIIIYILYTIYYKHILLKKARCWSSLIVESSNFIVWRTSASSVVSSIGPVELSDQLLRSWEIACEIWIPEKWECWKNPNIRSYLWVGSTFSLFSSQATVKYIGILSTLVGRVEETNNQVSCSEGFKWPIIRYLDHLVGVLHLRDLSDRKSEGKHHLLVSGRLICLITK